jgi:hypothetical protein
VKVIDFSAAYAPFFNGVFGPADLPSRARPTWPARPSRSPVARWKTWN